MLKNRILIFLALAASLQVAAQSVGTRATIEQSLGFEDQTSTELSGWNAPRESVAADNQITHNGHWSVRLERNARSLGPLSAISRALPVDFQGGTIELHGFLRLKDVSGSAGLWVREDGDGQTLALENMMSQQVNGTRDWAEYRITLPVHSEARRLYFGVLLSGAGTLWADDLRILIDGKPIAQAASKPTPLPIQAEAYNADHRFEIDSGVRITHLTSVPIKNLVTLGRVWGFLKYHHPSITDGSRDWDHELFRMLPVVIGSPDRVHANEAIVHWIDSLGAVPGCNPCISPPTGDLDIKPELDWIHDRSNLGGPLSGRLESIYANRTGRQFYISSAPAGNPVFDHESIYVNSLFPDAGYQLLALFRWWNILQYWDPYRQVADQDWTAVLAEFIPKLALANDKTAYQLALFELIRKANDTHANLWSSMALRPPLGDCALPVALRAVGDKFVVFSVNSSDSGFQRGDVLGALDGTPVQTLASKWGMYYDDSNEAARKRDLAANLIKGVCGPVSVELTRNGVPVQEVASRVPFHQRSIVTHDLPGDTFRLLSSDVAYIKLSSIKAVDLPTYFEKAKITKGLIVDIRNYPSEFMPFVMGAYFADGPTRFASFTVPLPANPGAFRFIDGPAIVPGPVHYSGRIVILVDEITQSQAEYTAMAFRAMPHSIVVGSTTAGADGNVSTIPLPGGPSTLISGLGVFYPDHRPTQRVGIVPDVVAKPTIEGIATGHDEVLETAIRFIENPRQGDD